MAIFFFAICVLSVHGHFDLQLIEAGKGEAIRIRAILRSLIPLEDLVGVISIPLHLPALNTGH